MLKNVASYKNRTEFVLDSRVNILIGTNGGGKTNLQKTIALLISKFLIQQYQFRKDDNVVGIEADSWSQRDLKKSFPKFRGDDSEQLIQIELIPELRDVENIKAIGQNLEKFNNELSFWERRYESYAPLPFADEIGTTAAFTFTIRNLIFEEPRPKTAEWAFREYLRELFIFLRVVSRIPDVTLSSPVFFFFLPIAL